MHRIREGVLMAEVSNLREPRILDAVVENVKAMLVENVTRTQKYHHVQEGELVLVN